MVIQNKKAFRNPSIYSKLIDYCSIDELGDYLFNQSSAWRPIYKSLNSLGTNFPPELYDGHLFGRESYYEELAKAQKEDMERRETLERKSAEARKKTGGDNRLRDSSSNQPLHRKSKWDQQVPGVRKE